MATIKIQPAAEQVIKEQFKMYCAPATTLREYTELESQSDPNFFRWLFGEEFDNDFDSDLTEAHKEVFANFLESL